MRKTKIVCTLGPASTDPEILRELMSAGMDVARFNFSHGDHEEQAAKYRMFDQVRREMGFSIGALLDTKGPEIRLGKFAEGAVELEKGQEFVLTCEEVAGDAGRATISYKELCRDVQPGSRILIDDGLIGMEVLAVEGGDIRCRVMNGGRVSNHKGINAPGAVLSMPYLSDKDRADILFGIEMGFDYIAASFVRSAEDVLAIRALLKENNSNIKIISKIENMQGVDNIESILEVSDGIMVARGDLGVEVPLEDVPGLQKKLIKMANAAGKHVITATQMLDSMMKNPRPTRAEATDVANAIYDGTTAIMLSGETAAGKYPVEAVATMALIAKKTEADIDYRRRLARTYAEDKAIKSNITDAIAHATCATAMDLKAKTIITVTMSGSTAEAISKYKPGCAIIGCALNERVANQLNLLWGVRPLILQEEKDAEKLFARAVEEALAKGYVHKGDVVVITAGMPLGVSGTTNMLRAVEV